MTYVFRSPRPDDAPALAELRRAAELADFGEAEDRSDYLQHLLARLDVRDGWLAEDGDGRIAAAGFVRIRHPTRLRSYGDVHPEHRGRGLGGELLRRILARARELGDGEDVVLGHSIAPTNRAAKELLERNGFELVRHFWKMGIELDDETPAPAWPQGIRLETLRPGREREVFEATEEAFRDHWDHTPHDYEEWRSFMVERRGFDPSLWLLARDGGELAGFSLCNLDAQEGWVGVLGVRRPWRRRGLGRALLLESFRVLRERGMPRAVLGVDAANPTGATALYEGAGMRVLRQEDAYWRRLT